MSVRDEISREIEAALEGGKEMTTAELFIHCHAAKDTSAVSRIINLMTREGTIELAREKPSAGFKAVKVWKLTTEKAEEPIMKEPEEAVQEPSEHACEACEARSHSEVVSRFLDNLEGILDEAMLRYADSMLENDPAWERLRAVRLALFTDKDEAVKEEASHD